MNPSPDNSESKSRKRSAPLDNWLPPGWRVEDKVRTSGATAGTVDKVDYLIALVLFGLELWIYRCYNQFYLIRKFLNW